MKRLGIFSCVVVLAGCLAQEDSLRSALTAIDRRERDLYDYPPEEAYSSPDDLEFLNKDPDQNDAKKRILSSFRERVEKDRQNQLSHNYLTNYEPEAEDRFIDNGDEEEYDEILRELLNKYEQQLYTRQNKRFYYPNLGLDGIGLRKRARYFNPEGPNDPYYINYLPVAPHERVFIPEEVEYYKNRERKFNQPTFNIQKRSSEQVRKQTDPKVEKELLGLFGKPQSSTTTPAPSSQKSPNENKDKTKKPIVLKKPATTKEVVANQMVPSKALNIKKKSINWSDYFGLDRRKKLGSDLRNDWLLNRYHKAITPRIVKKSTQSEKAEDKKIEDMDTKLKDIEDIILDDAIKYTGAHQGAITDTKEEQEVKDKIISRLAAAYSLEKMRNALNEYKLVVAKERERLKNSKQEKPESLEEEKRTSVARKQAVDEDRETIPEGDNEIKCAHGTGEDCLEQNYPTPNELWEMAFMNGVCPRIQYNCNSINQHFGVFGRGFEKPCAFHQMCLLCTSNTWSTPIQKCNTIFVQKLHELCNSHPNKIECRRIIPVTLQHSLTAYGNLQQFHQESNECEMACQQDSDSNYDLLDTR